MIRTPAPSSATTYCAGLAAPRVPPFQEQSHPDHLTRNSRRVLGVDEGIQKEEARKRLDEAKAASAQARGANDVAASALRAATRALQQVGVCGSWLYSLQAGGT